MTTKVLQTSQNLKSQYPLVLINCDNQDFTVHFSLKDENLVTSYPFEMRKLVLSCFILEQGDSRKDSVKCLGFFPQEELFVASIAQNICCFCSSGPKPDCLGYLLPPSGTRASVLTLTQPQPLKLAFLQRPACTSQSHTCPGHTGHTATLQPSMGKKGRKRSLVIILGQAHEESQFLHTVRAQSGGDSSGALW